MDDVWPLDGAVCLKGGAMRERQIRDLTEHGTRKAVMGWRGGSVLALVSAVLATAAYTATTGYRYDALGRLEQVTHHNGNVTTYTLDPAGNRKEVNELLTQPIPGPLNIPLTSTGSYTVSWSTGGSVSSYELYESTNSGFSSQTKVYQGAGTSASISGHSAGTYYYRVRGCAGNACTDYRTGTNGVSVNPPPPAPPAPTGLQKNANAYCSWGATWNVSAGATYYTIRDQSGNFQYNVPAPSSGSTVFTSYSYCNAPGYTGDPWDYRPKWVKACNASTCSTQSNFP